MRKAFLGTIGFCAILAATPISMGAAVSSCTPAEQQTAVQALPSDFGAVLCIVMGATSGMSVAAIAVQCGASEEAVGAEILALVEEATGNGADAGTIPAAAGVMLAATPAYDQAHANFKAQALVPAVKARHAAERK